MSAESLPERIRKVVPRALSDLPAFDGTDPLHVDHVARHLLQRLRDQDDGEAFTLLIDLTQEKLSAAAQEVAREVGLVKDPDDLVAACFSRLFTDVRRGRPDVRHFLQEATDRMRAEADAWVRDLACMELPTGKVRSTADDRYETIVKICYHRLDPVYRRLLRAGDVEAMDVGQMAATFSMSEEDVRRDLLEGRARLSQAIAKAMGRSQP